ncbi:hypothetical protein [Filimonas effusa]|uniref:Uncharacterized protein n=1 Tax=Filimonas effusa TaxID=2508721 RepID=A0A4Q1D4S4_9BACT|nr:hypothetical protein [Filimonas effusa]RXK83429.1 hypothetical protein ESB13_15145 [Filimonas effusa]
MAKQTGPVIREGTIGKLNFYKRGGKGFLRKKSNLTGKRWFSDPAFAGSRKSAANMAQASILASAAYNGIPKLQRCFADYRRLAGIACKILSAGGSEQQAQDMLAQEAAQICLRPAVEGGEGNG